MELDYRVFDTNDGTPPFVDSVSRPTETQALNNLQAAYDMLQKLHLTSADVYLTHIERQCWNLEQHYATKRKRNRATPDSLDYFGMCQSIGLRLNLSASQVQAQLARVEVKLRYIDVSHYRTTDKRGSGNHLPIMGGVHIEAT